jgi:Ca-activated chloride channel homolog
MIYWGAWHNGWIFPIAALLMGLAWYKYIRRNRVAAMLDKRGTQLKHFSPTKNIAKAVLFCGGVLGIALALLHPKWGQVDEQVEQHGRDVLIALDISRSMLTQDCKPDRLTVAKNSLKQLVAALETDMVSLMVFSEKSRIYCPLTKDVELVNMFLDYIDYTTIGSGTTMLDKPIQSAIEQCARFPERKSKLLLLVTDGEDFSTSLDELKKRAQAIGLTIFIIGVGTREGAPIPLYDEFGKQQGYVKDEQGHVVISHLQPESLTQLAQGTGGIAIMLDDQGASVHDIVRKIQQFEQERQGQHRVMGLQEQYAPFLLVSFLCFLCEWLL